MLKLNRVVDYGIVIVCHLIREEEHGPGIASAKEIAGGVHLSQPMVSKILKHLVRSGIIVSARGLHGGYSLAPEARKMSLGGLIRALDGPVRLTECSPRPLTELIGCELHGTCSLRGTMMRLNSAVQNAFDTVTLAELARPFPAPAAGLALPSRLEPKPGGSGSPSAHVAGRAS